MSKRPSPPDRRCRWCFYAKPSAVADEVLCYRWGLCKRVTDVCEMFWRLDLDVARAAVS